MFGPNQTFELGDFRYSTGLNAIWFSPLGALTFSYAIPLKSEATDEEKHSTSLLVLRSEAHMRLRFAKLACLAFISLAFVMQPALAANLKIGIDLQRAATESPQAESARKKIDREP